MIKEKAQKNEIKTYSTNKEKGVAVEGAVKINSESIKGKTHINMLLLNSLPLFFLFK